MRTKRSHYNMNRIGTYNMVDAQIDNPHTPTRSLPSLVNKANDIRFRPKGKKVA